VNEGAGREWKMLLTQTIRVWWINSNKLRQEMRESMEFPGKEETMENPSVFFEGDALPEVGTPFVIIAKCEECRTGS
jgi:hypothetical protein